MGNKSFFSNAIRTQLAAGYDYSSTPAKQIADFFDPGYVTQSFGFNYDKYPILLHVLVSDYRRFLLIIIANIQILKISKKLLNLKPELNLLLILNLR